MKEKDALGDMFIGIESSEKETEFIPIITDDEDEKPSKKIKMPKSLPILPLRNTVLFPGIVLPITVGRNKSLQLVKDVYKKDKIIGTVAQIDGNIEEPEFKDLYKVGTIAQIVKILEMPDGSTTVIIQGKNRFKINELLSSEPYYTANIESLKEVKAKPSKKYEAIVESLKEISIQIINLSANIPHEASFAVKNIENFTFLINYVCSNNSSSIKDKQNMLEVNDMMKRANLVLTQLTKELQMLELKNDIQSKVKVDIDQQQRKFMLHQQMKTIQDELGSEIDDQEVKELVAKAKKKKFPAEVKEIFEKETKRLKRVNPAAPEYSVQLNYLQVLLELPWNEYTKDNFNLKRAQQVLDKDHFGLEKVKDRILEHLAVLKLKGDMHSPILCLVGPPGVGKTSLGKSVADALNRKYIRMSLGGLHDEAEIRGHRKTYIGAMPGRIIQNIRKAKSSNPVFVLDEIDKVGNDFHGDPSSALLEVLDPEQNNAFYDNYIESEFDLSKVMFIATANTTNSISLPLLDRMEIIDVTGYIIEEKIEIAKRYLIPKQLEAHGVKKNQIVFSKKSIEYVIVNYTRESGVRELNKTFAKITRNVAKKIAMETSYNKNLLIEDIIEFLGVPRYLKNMYQGNEFAGVVTGLAWTAVGGTILFIESSLSKGEGKLTITGNLGDVMKESAIIALEYCRSHAVELSINPEVFSKWNIHIHVPEGAIPKDGPSAGITMAVSIASSFTQRKIKQQLAMTGELTLRGKVLPIGGVKEKILAAKRADIKEIILPEENRKDVEEIKEIYVIGLKFNYVSNVMDVINIALLNEKVNKPLQLN